MRSCWTRPWFISRLCRREDKVRSPSAEGCRSSNGVLEGDSLSSLAAGLGCTIRSSDGESGNEATQIRVSGALSLSDSSDDDIRADMRTELREEEWNGSHHAGVIPAPERELGSVHAECLEELEDGSQLNHLDETWICDRGAGNDERLSVDLEGEYAVSGNMGGAGHRSTQEQDLEVIHSCSKSGTPSGTAGAVNGTNGRSRGSGIPRFTDAHEKTQQLMMELSEYLLERGVIEDRRQAASAAGLCLDLLRVTMARSTDKASSSPSPVGPTELVLLGDFHLDVSSTCSRDSLASLLAWLVSGQALEYIEVGDKLDVWERAARMSHGWAEQSNGIPSQKRQIAMVMEAVASPAVTALVEAYQAWQDVLFTIEAWGLESSSCLSEAGARLDSLCTDSDMNNHSSSSNSSSSKGGSAVSINRTQSTPAPPTRYSERHCLSAMDLHATEASSPSSAATWTPSSSEARRCSHAAAAGGVRALPGERTCRNRDRLQQLQQAVRVVTARAKGCYGQLVILGHKEFTVRESTWHPVGRTNDCFLLMKRVSPNGVRIVSDEVDDVSSPDKCRKGTNVNGASPSPRVGDEVTLPTTGKWASAASSMGKEAYRTPESRSLQLAEPSRAVAAAIPSRARSSGIGACGACGAYDAGAEDSNRAENAQGGDVGNLWPYRIFLVLSEAQREEANRVGLNVEKMSSTSNVSGGGGGGHTVAGGGASKSNATPSGTPAETEVVGMICHQDSLTDMFQLGRMQGPENDFVVRGPLHQSTPQSKVCGPISRYAVRLLVDRAAPHRCRIYAGGFNSRKFMALPKACPKWRTKNGAWDAVTAFGVRVLKPEIGDWREVTVAGAMHRPRVHELEKIGELMPEETNELTTGTIVDFGGVQMLYESAQSMVRLGGMCPSRIVKTFNSLKPQCPVQLQPLRFKPWSPLRRQRGSIRAFFELARRAGIESKRRRRAWAVEGGVENAHMSVASPQYIGLPLASPTCTDGDGDDEARALVPHIRPACGHVHSYAPQLTWGPCPMCRTRGPLVEMAFGGCRAIDRDLPEVVFNPCGHVASRKVAEWWAAIPMPNNAPPDAVYRPICPYCAQPLSSSRGEKPYSKIVFLH